jgi:stage V sporulation protein R
VATDWTVEELKRWDERIREKAAAFGLSVRPQEFEICDREQMLGYMAYTGMPAHYPHWSFGKRFERLKTLHEYGITGLPYELVINSSPVLAYLMRDNTLCQQILTMAHVYGHNDFFRNNFQFRNTAPEFSVGRFKLWADRIRAYVEDPSIGLSRVEEVLDAAHALSLHLGRHSAIRKRSREEQELRMVERASPRYDPHAQIRTPEEPDEVDLTRVPLEPEEDVLLFIRDHNPYLADWERDLLTIVHEQARYFVPQMETKIMNEGWATYWHHRILHALGLPEDLHMEFLVHHNQVIGRPRVGLNPYHLGFVLWHDIRRRAAGEGGAPGDVDTRRFHDAAEDPLPGEEELLKVREVDRDVSFLRRFLTEEIMRELDLFEYERRGEDLVVSRISDPGEWARVKETLVRQVGMGSVPVVRIVDADVGRRGVLLLEHEHDGRDLDLEYAAETLRHLHRLWGRTVLLDSRVDNDPVRLSYDAEGGFQGVSGRGRAAERAEQGG